MVEVTVYADDGKVYNANLSESQVEGKTVEEITKEVEEMGNVSSGSDSSPGSISESSSSSDSYSDSSSDSSYDSSSGSNSVFYLIKDDKTGNWISATVKGSQRQLSLNDIVNVANKLGVNSLRLTQEDDDDWDVEGSSGTKTVRASLKVKTVPTQVPKVSTQSDSIVKSLTSPVSQLSALYYANMLRNEIERAHQLEELAKPFPGLPKEILDMEKQSPLMGKVFEIEDSLKDTEEGKPQPLQKRTLQVSYVPWDSPLSITTNAVNWIGMEGQKLATSAAQILPSPLKKPATTLIGIGTGLTEGIVSGITTVIDIPKDIVLTEVKEINNFPKEETYKSYHLAKAGEDLLEGKLKDMAIDAVKSITGKAGWDTLTDYYRMGKGSIGILYGDIQTLLGKNPGATPYEYGEALGNILSLLAPVKSIGMRAGVKMRLKAGEIADTLHESVERNKWRAIAALESVKDRVSNSEVQKRITNLQKSIYSISLDKNKAKKYIEKTGKTIDTLTTHIPVLDIGINARKGSLEVGIGRTIYEKGWDHYSKISPSEIVHREHVVREANKEDKELGHTVEENLNVKLDKKTLEPENVHQVLSYDAKPRDLVKDTIFRQLDHIREPEVTVDTQIKPGEKTQIYAVFDRDTYFKRDNRIITPKSHSEYIYKEKPDEFHELADIGLRETRHGLAVGLLDREETPDGQIYETLYEIDKVRTPKWESSSFYTSDGIEMHIAKTPEAIFHHARLGNVDLDVWALKHTTEKTTKPELSLNFKPTIVEHKIEKGEAPSIELPEREFISRHHKIGEFYHVKDDFFDIYSFQHKLGKGILDIYEELLNRANSEIVKNIARILFEPHLNEHLDKQNMFSFSALDRSFSHTLFDYPALLDKRERTISTYGDVKLDLISTQIKNHYPEEEAKRLASDIHDILKGNFLQDFTINIKRKNIDVFPKAKKHLYTPKGRKAKPTTFPSYESQKIEIDVAKPGEWVKGYVNSLKREYRIENEEILKDRLERETNNALRFGSTVELEKVSPELEKETVKTTVPKVDKKVLAKGKEMIKDVKKRAKEKLSDSLAPDHTNLLRKNIRPGIDSKVDKSSKGIDKSLSKQHNKIFDGIDQHFRELDRIKTHEIELQRVKRKTTSRQKLVRKTKSKEVIKRIPETKVRGKPITFKPEIEFIIPMLHIDRKGESWKEDRYKKRSGLVREKSIRKFHIIDISKII